MVEVCDSADKLEEERRGVFEALNRRPSGVTQHKLDTARRALHVAGRDRRLYEAVHRTSGAKPAGPFCDLTQADDATQCPALAAALVEAIRQLAGSVTQALSIPDIKRIKGLAKGRLFYIDCTPTALSSSLSAFLAACFLWSEHMLVGSRFVVDRITLVIAPRGDQAWEEYVIKQQGLLISFTRALVA